MGYRKGQYYSGPVQGFFCQTGEPDSFSTGNDVHTHRKYQLKGVFQQKGGLSGVSNLQNIRLLFLPFFSCTIPRGNEMKACFQDHDRMVFSGLPDFHHVPEKSTRSLFTKRKTTGTGKKIFTCLY
jgi:hypothetical protein